MTTFPAASLSSLRLCWTAASKAFTADVLADLTYSGENMLLIIMYSSMKKCKNTHQLLPPYIYLPKDSHPGARVRTIHNKPTAH